MYLLYAVGFIKRLILTNIYTDVKKRPSAQRYLMRWMKAPALC